MDRPVVGAAHLRKQGDVRCERHEDGRAAQVDWVIAGDECLVCCRDEESPCHAAQLLGDEVITHDDAVLARMFGYALLKEQAELVEVECIGESSTLRECSLELVPIKLPDKLLPDGLDPLLAILDALVQVADVVDEGVLLCGRDHRSGRRACCFADFLDDRLASFLKRGQLILDVRIVVRDDTCFLQAALDGVMVRLVPRLQRSPALVDPDEGQIGGIGKSFEIELGVVC